MNKKALILLLVLLAIPIFYFFPVHAHEPAEPFTMIMVNDPQFFWYRPANNHQEEEYYSVRENYWRVSAINRMGEGFWADWPSISQIDQGIGRNNTMFDRSMCSQQLLRPEGVVINGDLVFGHDYYDVGYDYAKNNGYEPLASRGQSTEGLFRDIYGLLDSDYDMFPGLGNHDTANIVKDFVETLDVNQHGDYEWSNFRAGLYRDIYNMQEDWREVKPTPSGFKKYWRGSFAYSWDISNYRFIQLNNYPNFRKEYIWGGFLLPKYGFDVTTSHDFLKERAEDAFLMGMRVVICYHSTFSSTGYDYQYDTKFNNILANSNVVAIFKGHTMTGGGSPDGIPVGFCENVGVTNAFGLNIPVFQGGHSGCAEDHNGVYANEDCKFLLAEFADDHLDVGVIDCAEGYPNFFRPWKDKHLRTIGPFNKKPYIMLDSPTGIYEGTNQEVVSGNFSDSDPQKGYTWIGEVDMGDGNVFYQEYTAIDNYTTGTYPYEHSHFYDFYSYHRYEDDGIYTVKVKMTDSLGATGTANVSVTVLNADPIISNFRMSQEFMPGYFMVFADLTDPGVLDTLDATVDWGDGTVTPAVQFLYKYRVVSSNQYDENGNFDVTLTVTDHDGGKASKTTRITVTQITPETPNEPPVASFTYSPLDPQVNDTVTFDASSCSDTDGTIVSYLWDFGDGDTSTTQNPTHAYDQEGAYIVTLTVTDDDGLTDTATVNIGYVVIPEFSSWTSMLIALIGVVAIIVIYRHNIHEQNRGRDKLHFANRKT